MLGQVMELLKHTNTVARQGVNTMKYTIVYSGWTSVEVEANSKEEAEDKFYDDGLNALYDSNIDDVQPTEAIKVSADYSQYDLVKEL